MNQIMSNYDKKSEFKIIGRLGTTNVEVDDRNTQSMNSFSESHLTCIFVIYLFTVLLILVAVEVCFVRKRRTLSNRNKSHQEPC